MILAPFIFISAFSNILAHMLEAGGMQRDVMKFNAVSCCFNEISNLIFIPIAGMYAAAIKTVCTESINAFLHYRALKSQGISLAMSKSDFPVILLLIMFSVGYAASSMDLWFGILTGTVFFIPMYALMIKSYQRINKGVTT